MTNEQSNNGKSNFESIRSKFMSFKVHKDENKLESHGLDEKDSGIYVDSTRDALENKIDKFKGYEFLLRVAEAKEWLENILNISFEQRFCPLEERFKQKNVKQQQQLERQIQYEENGQYKTNMMGFTYHLMDGEILLKLANLFLKKINKKEAAIQKNIQLDTRMTFAKVTNNITTFLNKVKEDFGFPPYYLFETPDLWERKNIIKVIYCIHAFAHHLEEMGLLSPHQRIRNLSKTVEIDENDIKNAAEEIEDIGDIMSQLDFRFGQNDDQIGSEFDSLQDGDQKIFYRVTGEGAKFASLHQPALFTIHVEQANHHNCEVYIKNKLTGEYINTHVTPFDQGFHVEYTVNSGVVGVHYELWCNISGQEDMINEYLKISSGPADPHTSRLLDPQHFKKEKCEGVVQEFKIQACDSSGSETHVSIDGGPIASLTYAYVLGGTNPLRMKHKAITEEVIQDEHGLLTIKYHTPIPGQYLLNVKIQGKDLQTFPQKVIVTRLGAPRFQFDWSRALSQPRCIQFGFKVSPEGVENEYSSARYVSIIRKGKDNQLTRQMVNFVQSQFSGIVSQFVDQGRKECFKFYCDPKDNSGWTVDDELPYGTVEEPAISKEDTTGDILWLMTKWVKHYSISDQLNQALSSAIPDIAYLTISDEYADWSSIMHEIPPPDVSILNPRRAELGYWERLYRLIIQTKSQPIMNQMVHQFEDGAIVHSQNDLMCVREFKKTDTYHVVRVQDLLDYADLNLIVARHLVSDFDNVLQESINDFSHRQLTKNIQDRVKEVHDEFNKHHAVIEEIIRGTTYIAKDKVLKPDDVVAPEYTNHVLKLFKIIKRAYLSSIQNFVSFVTENHLKPTLSKSQLSILTKNPLFSKSLDALHLMWRIAAGKELSERRRRIYVYELSIPLSELRSHRFKNTIELGDKPIITNKSWCIMTPLNSMFDINLTNEQCNRSTKEIDGSGLLNPWKFSYVKNNTVLLEAMRTGCLPPILKENSKREQMGLSNATTLLRALAMNHAKRFTRSELTNLDGPLQVSFTSLSLLTPSIISHNEDRLAFEHEEAILSAIFSDKVNRITVDLHDGKDPLTVPVKFERVSLLNFGTNIAMKTLGMGVDYQRMINARVTGFRSFELKVNIFLEALRVRKNDLRKEIDAIVQQFTNVPANQFGVNYYKQYLNALNGYFVKQGEIMGQNQKRIMSLTAEIAERQKKLESLFVSKIIPRLSSPAKLSYLWYKKLKGLVYDIVDRHKKLYELELEFQCIDEKQQEHIEYQQSYVSLLEQFMKKHGNIFPQIIEYVELETKTNDVMQLYNDVRYVFHNKHHEQGGTNVTDLRKNGLREMQNVQKYDPYAAIVRIILLSNILGEQVHWNCKSGKDRTGEAQDQLCEYIEWRHQFGSYPSALDEADKFSDHRRAIRTTLGLNCHTFDISKVNMGIPGSKADAGISGRFLDGHYKLYKGMAQLDTNSYYKSALSKSFSNAYQKLEKCALSSASSNY